MEGFLEVGVARVWIRRIESKATLIALKRRVDGVLTWFFIRRIHAAPGICEEVSR